MTVHSLIDTPLGEIVLEGDGEAVTSLAFAGRRLPRGRRDDDALAPAATELREYFAGARTTFDVPLRATGTRFEHLVWDALAKIPYGATTTYGELAAKLGHPGAARAVGLANARNRIAVIVPCHRVIGANGRLTGYAYGVDRKSALLRLEGALL